MRDIIQYKLEKDYIELCNLLKIKNLVNTGGCAKTVISEGKVLIDSKIETKKEKVNRFNSIINELK